MTFAKEMANNSMNTTRIIVDAFMKIEKACYVMYKKSITTLMLSKNNLNIPHDIRLYLQINQIANWLLKNGARSLNNGNNLKFDIRIA